MIASFTILKLFWSCRLIYSFFQQEHCVVKRHHRILLKCKLSRPDEIKCKALTFDTTASFPIYKELQTESLNIVSWNRLTKDLNINKAHPSHSATICSRQGLKRPQRNFVRFFVCFFLEVFFSWFKTFPFISGFIVAMRVISDVLYARICFVVRQRHIRAYLSYM